MYIVHVHQVIIVVILCYYNKATDVSKILTPFVIHVITTFWL